MFVLLYPFARENVSSARKKTRVLQFGRALTHKKINLSHHVLSIDEGLCGGLIKNWGLAWWCGIFPVGPTFEDHPQIFSKKKVQPLGFYFWHLRLDLFKSLFCWWSWPYARVPFCRDKWQMYLQQRKHIFCNLGARWHKFLEFVPLWLNQKLSKTGDWPGDAAFSLRGQPLKITRKFSAKKKSSPLDSIFDTCASTSSSHFFVGEAEHMCLYPFASANISAALQAFHGGIYLLVITFVISELERQEKKWAVWPVILLSESTWVGLPHYRQTQIQLPVSKSSGKDSFSDAWPM